MALIRINRNPSIRELRQFAGIWFPLFWVLVAGVVYATSGSRAMAAGIAATGLALGGMGLNRPGFMRPIYLVWIYAAYPIGWVVSHLIMGAVFYLVVTPIGFAMRVAGYDPMRRRLQQTESTYWYKCEPIDSKGYYFRQY